MQSVIGGYDRIQDAQKAVRSIQDNKLSFEALLIADQLLHTWRKPYARSYDDGSMRLDARFLVLMRGEPEVVDRARTLLSLARIILN